MLLVEIQIQEKDLALILIADAMKKIIHQVNSILMNEESYRCINVNRNIVVFRDITRKVPQYFYKLLYDYIVAMNKSAYATVCTAVAMMTATILAMSIPVIAHAAPPVFPPRINGNGAHAPGIPGLNANGGSGGTGVVGQNGGIGTDGTKGGAGQSGSVCINNVCTP